MNLIPSKAENIWSVVVPVWIQKHKQWTGDRGPITSSASSLQNPEPTCNLQVYFNSFREIQRVELEDERCLGGAGLRIVQGEAPAVELQTKVKRGFVKANISQSRRREKAPTTNYKGFLLVEST